MKRAYELSSQLVRERLEKEAPDTADLLENLGKSDLIVIDGTYDHIHLVLDALKMPYGRITHDLIDTVTFHPHQTIFVNCASNFPAEGARKLATFVADGGQLITTDWALKNVLEIAFPGVVEYNNKPTSDEVVRIEVLDREDAVIRGFLDEETEPVWWLEGSSYPIRILDAERVKVLIHSKELKEKYGEAPVIIRFEHGEGIVYHMISHFYLQRTETREARQTQSAGEYAGTKGASSEVVEAFAAEEEVNYGEVQAASTSTEFIYRAVIQQKKRFKGKGK